MSLFQLSFLLCMLALLAVYIGIGYVVAKLFSNWDWTKFEIISVTILWPEFLIIYIVACILFLIIAGLVSLITGILFLIESIQSLFNKG